MRACTVVVVDAGTTVVAGSVITDVDGRSCCNVGFSSVSGVSSGGGVSFGGFSPIKKREPLTRFSLH